MGNLWYIEKKEGMTRLEMGYNLIFSIPLGSWTGNVMEILYVEDNAADVRLMVEALKEMKQPVNLTVAADGMEAMLYFSRCGRYSHAPVPDLIMLDLRLPCKNGDELLLAIRKDEQLRRLPVMMISTSESELDAMRKKEPSADYYITKSSQLAQFNEMIRTVVNGCMKREDTPEAILKEDDPRIRILLVEDNPGDARLIREALVDLNDQAFVLEHVDQLAKGLARLAQGGVDVMLLDLTLPDSSRPDTFIKIREHSWQIPIVVLTGLNDETVAVEAVHEGAQDYLVKGRVDGMGIQRSIRYAIERHRMRRELRDMSLRDELTGLYNRRGFLELAQHQLKVAGRFEKGLFILFADLDNMKQINDSFGHAEGDCALVETARILTDTFRDSDIIGRIGGDEFAVLAVETAHAGADILKARVELKIEECRVRPGNKFHLSISVGIAHYDPETPASVDELLERADALMYEEKRLHRQK